MTAPATSSPPRHLTAPRDIRPPRLLIPPRSRSLGALPSVLEGGAFDFAFFPDGWPGRNPRRFWVPLDKREGVVKACPPDRSPPTPLRPFCKRKTAPRPIFGVLHQ